MRGTLTEPGRASPDRDRSVETNLGLFRDMRAGKFANGACVLRAKIDLASGNMNLRDPVYHLRAAAGTGGHLPDPMISHMASPTPWNMSRTRFAPWSSRTIVPSTTGSSVPLPVPARPRQTEFARLNIGYTVLFQRHLTDLVRRGIVAAGTIRACQPSQVCVAAACRRRRSATSFGASACPRPTASSISPCSITQSATISIRWRIGAWRSCGRSSS